MLEYVRTTLSIKFHKILCIISGATLATKFLSHTQTDRHFPEIVKLGSGHPTTCKSIKKPEVESFDETNITIYYYTAILPYYNTTILLYYNTTIYYVLQYYYILYTTILLYLLISRRK